MSCICNLFFCTLIILKNGDDYIARITRAVISTQRMVAFTSNNTVLRRDTFPLKASSQILASHSQENTRRGSKKQSEHLH